MTFTESLDYGTAGESLISRWMRKRGNWVLPVYEKVIDTGKGPQLFTPDAGVSLICPDLFVFSPKERCWVEAKRKSAFTWHRISQRWVTGIDLRHYGHYLEVDDKTPWPVWLLFLHENGQAKDSPPGCPTGLFGEALQKLRKCENHRSDKYGKDGMVYWACESLRKLAELQDVLSLT